jgi:hypothetical protein
MGQLPTLAAAWSPNFRMSAGDAHEKFLRNPTSGSEEQIGA